MIDYDIDSEPLRRLAYDAFQKRADGVFKFSLSIDELESIFPTSETETARFDIDALDHFLKNQLPGWTIGPPTMFDIEGKTLTIRYAPIESAQAI